MDHENKGAHAMHLVAPAESEKGKGGEMVDEHLPEVFPLHVGELGDKEGPVKSHLKHVVPPNGWVCEKKELWDLGWNGFMGVVAFYIIYVFQHPHLAGGTDSYTSSKTCFQPKAYPKAPTHY